MITHLAPPTVPIQLVQLTSRPEVMQIIDSYDQKVTEAFARIHDQPWEEAAFPGAMRAAKWYLSQCRVEVAKAVRNAGRAGAIRTVTLDLGRRAVARG